MGGAIVRGNPSRFGIRLVASLGASIGEIGRGLGLDTLVLADHWGEPIASMGPSEVVREVAMQSPWLVNRSTSEMNETLSLIWHVCPQLTAERVVAEAISGHPGSESVVIVAVGDRPALLFGVAHARKEIEWRLRHLPPRPPSLPPEIAMIGSPLASVGGGPNRLMSRS